METRLYTYNYERQKLKPNLIKWYFKLWKHRPPHVVICTVQLMPFLFVFKAYWPLWIEDAIKECVICRSPFCWWEGVHVLDHIVGQLIVSLAQELSFGKRGPASLQGALASNITLTHERIRGHQAQPSTATLGWYNWYIISVSPVNIQKYGNTQITFFFINTNASPDISYSTLWETLKAYLRGKIISYFLAAA